MIEVVGAVLVLRDERQARILLTQRPPWKDYPLHWESPGGKVEGNESHHQALIREVREELGVEIDPDRIGQNSIFRMTIKRDGLEPVLVMLYRAEPLQGTANPRPLEGQGIGWFGRTELAALMLTPGNRAARETIDRLLYVLDG